MGTDVDRGRSNRNASWLTGLAAVIAADTLGQGVTTVATWCAYGPRYFVNVPYGRWAPAWHIETGLLQIATVTGLIAATCVFLRRGSAGGWVWAYVVVTALWVVAGADAFLMSPGHVNTLLGLIANAAWPIALILLWDSRRFQRLHVLFGVFLLTRFTPLLIYRVMTYVELRSWISLPPETIAMLCVTGLAGVVAIVCGVVVLRNGNTLSTVAKVLVVAALLDGAGNAMWLFHIARGPVTSANALSTIILRTSLAIYAVFWARSVAFARSTTSARCGYDLRGSVTDVSSECGDLAPSSRGDAH